MLELANIYVMGDIHRSIAPIKNFTERNQILIDAAAAGKKNILILLGDAGINYYMDSSDKVFKSKLKKFPFEYFIIRGNHEERPSILVKEEPKKWHLEEYLGGKVWVEDRYPHIKYAMDYVSLYKIPYQIVQYSDGTKAYNTYQTIVIPGAYSVDKYYRLQNNWQWFPQEQLSYEEKWKSDLLLRSINYSVDLVLSHTCPLRYEPKDLFIKAVDQSTVDKSMEQYLEGVESKLNYRAWLWGHYHAFRDYPRGDGKARTMLYKDEAIDLLQYMKDIPLNNSVEKL